MVLDTTVSGLFGHPKSLLITGVFVDLGCLAFSSVFKKKIALRA
jgi:hypothetical protein